MTKAEYQELYRKARQETAKLSLKAQIQVSLVYRKASSEIAQKLKIAVDNGYSIITINHLSQLQSELDAISSSLANEIENISLSLVTDSVKVYTLPDELYLLDAVSKIPSIRSESIKSIYEKINVQAVQNMVSRVYEDGYTFSNRIWNLKNGYEDTIKEIITSGIAQGRDPVDIIKDIQAYTADGKVALSKRWADLEEGSAEWKKRIHERIDWRAQRLVRSELQATMQSISVLNGESNPAATGEYEWILGPGLGHCAECLDYSTQTFTKDNIPDYPHPNCGCQIRPILMDRDEFMDDLVAWSNGQVTDDNRYIEEWAQIYYNAA